jgi:rod shape-determining protein MreD
MAAFCQLVWRLAVSTWVDGEDIRVRPAVEFRNLGYVSVLIGGTEGVDRSDLSQGSFFTPLPIDDDKRLLEGAECVRNTAMKDQQSYFEKADFQSNLPKQFLVMFVAVLLVLLEVGLAQWPFFYGASPLLSLIFLYFIMIYHDELMPIMTVFIMGLIADFLMSDILGGRATALMLLSYAMRVGVLRLQQSDFMDLWVGFAVSCTAVILFQLIVFTVVHFAVPSLSPLLFQLGFTLILFPIGFVMMFSIQRLLQTLQVMR